MGQRGQLLILTVQAHKSRGGIKLESGMGPERDKNGTSQRKAEIELRPSQDGAGVRANG